MFSWMMKVEICTCNFLFFFVKTSTNSWRQKLDWIWRNKYKIFQFISPLKRYTPSSFSASSIIVRICPAFEYIMHGSKHFRYSSYSLISLGDGGPLSLFMTFGVCITYTFEGKKTWWNEWVEVSPKEIQILVSTDSLTLIKYTHAFMYEEVHIRPFELHTVLMS